MSADGLVTAMCTHGMDAAWCYLCHVDGYGVDPQVLWGLALDDDLEELAERPGPMSKELAGTCASSVKSSTSGTTRPSPSRRPRP